jgi:replicative DNA helicase Mcm
MLGGEFPDARWRDNLQTLLRWKDYDIISKMDNGETYVLDVSHPYIKPFYEKYKEEVKELAYSAVINILQEVWKGKYIATFHFSNIKIKLEEEVNSKLRNISPIDENTPKTFNCVVLAVGRRQAYPKLGYYVCPKCGHQELVESDKRRKIKKEFCHNKTCKLQPMELDEDQVRSGFIQDIVIQEPIDEIINNQPVYIDAKLIDDDVGHTYMGQKKKITGIFRVDYDGKSKQKDIYMDIADIKDLDDVELIMPTDEQLTKWVADSNKGGFMDKLIGSFAPHIFGYEKIKLGMLLSIISKRGRINDRRRGWINLLLVGDPGMAKSMLLEWVQNITQKSTYTTGKGSTAAGLTAGMVKQDNGTSILQAGNYPLSHKGTAIVDEFDKMNKDDMGIMHEVMEQGMVTRSVSGKNVRLPAEAVTLAAANPRFGTYDDSLTLMENINLPTPIVSRFDVIFLIKDKVDSIMDAKKADKVLNDFGDGSEDKDVYMDEHEMTAFVNYVSKIDVQLTKEAQYQLKKIYDKLRQISKDKKSVPVTPRTLEALGRLAMAHARAHFKTEADVDDVKAVYNLYRESYHTFGKELEDSGEQLTLMKSEKLNKEQELRKAWSKCEDDDKYVKEEDLIYILEKEYFWEKDKARKKWNDLYGQGYIKKCSNMKYRWNE